MPAREDLNTLAVYLFVFVSGEAGLFAVEPDREREFLLREPVPRLVVLGGNRRVRDELRRGVDEVRGEALEGASETIEDGAALRGPGVATGLVLEADNECAVLDIRPGPRKWILILQVPANNRSDLRVAEHRLHAVVVVLPSGGCDTP